MRINNISGLLKQMGFSEEKESKQTDALRAKGDRIEISNTSKAFKKVESFLNLGRPDRLDTSDLNKSERTEFLNMIARLLKEGIVGYEILEVDGKPEKHFIVTQIGNERIKGAKLYNHPGYYDKR